MFLWFFALVTKVISGEGSNHESTMLLLTYALYKLEEIA